MNFGTVLATCGFIFLLGCSGFLFWMFPSSSSYKNKILWLIVALPFFALWYFAIRAVILAPVKRKERKRFYRALAEELKPTEIEEDRPSQTTCKAVIRWY